MQIYERLRALREDRDLRQVDIANVLNTAREQYHKYETGKQEIPVRHIVTLARFYDVSADYLLCLVDVARSLSSGKRIDIRQFGKITNNFN